MCIFYESQGKMQDRLLIGTEEYKYRVVERDDEKFSFIRRFEEIFNPCVFIYHSLLQFLLMRFHGF